VRYAQERKLKHFVPNVIVTCLSVLTVSIVIVSCISYVFALSAGKMRCGLQISHA
jgi:hypothetical protein